jgi:membrane protein YdbS with pleckstrin-like domain
MSDRVVYLPLECLSLGATARKLEAKQVTLIGIGMFFLACAIGAGLYFLTSNPLSVNIIISAFVWLIAFTFVEILVSRLLRYRRRRSLANSNDPLAREMVRFADVHQPGILFKLFKIDHIKKSIRLTAAQEKSLEGLRNARPQPPIVVCDQQLEDKIGKIEPLENMAEPEALGIGGITRWGISSLLTLFFGLLSSACLFSINVNVRGMHPMWFKIIALLVICMTVLGTPIRGWIQRWWRRDSAQYVIGPGFFTESSGRFFTVADSVLVVCKNPREVSTELRVWLVGNGRLRRMKFNSTGDKQFVRLWRFWTSRDPRPELAPTMQTD